MPVHMTRRLAMVVGDTAGHVLPALAVAAAYRQHAPDVDVLFLSAADGHASRLVPAAGYRLEIVPGAPLARAGVIGRLAAVGRTVEGFAAARRLLAAAGARLVIGSGGYASGGVLLAARSLGLRTALIEPNVEPGLANRLLARVAHRAYLTHPATERFFPTGRSLVTGTPVQPRIVQALDPERRPGARPRPRRLLVTGGSRGDAFLAAEAPPLARALAARGLALSVCHQTGQVPADEVARAYRNAGVPASVSPYLDMACAYATADLAIARAGAGTLAELALAGLPALLVPLADAAADHQAVNARAAADAGSAIWIRERDWTVERVVDLVWPLLTRMDVWDRMAAAARRQARPDAAAAVVEDCERQMQGRW
ncbi:MAG TPA: UDP-N-acetylglucosamine--N-acetylmuramyl-(pentapeptide) pyrophosphoryl-undecaprenol N-acetylglucosamine transferase [Methylomirabilota bacterium]